MSEPVSLQRVPPSPPEVPGTITVPAYSVEQEGGAGLPVVEYWRILRKRRWTVVSILLLVVVTVMIGTLKQRPVYRSKAVLQIDRENQNVFSFKEVFELDTSNDDFLETAYKILASRTLAYRVIRKLHLENSPDFAVTPPQGSPGWMSRIWRRNPPGGAMAGTGDEQADPKYKDAIDSFLSRLRINPVRRSRLVEITFDSYDPAESAMVVNTLAASYIDENLEAKWDATQKASEWLSQQLVGLKAKLEKSDEDLQRYAKENSILFLDEKQSMGSQKLKQLQEESTRAQADLIQKESLYNQVKGGDFSSVPGILENKMYQDLSLKLADLRREYSDLTATFTPEYPRVKRLSSQINETESLLQREQRAFAQRVTDDYRVAANRKRLLDQAVAAQTKEFNQIAEKSIQYNILKRESDTNRQLYEGLLSRVKEASVSAGIRASNIRVVDKGEMPTSPAEPRVALNLALALLFGFGIGVGMAFFQEYLDNTLKTPDDVQRYLRLPALGVIPAADSNGRGKLPYGYGYGYSSRKSLPVTQPATATNAVSLNPDLIGTNGNGQMSEAYRSLRTSVLLSTSGSPPRVILITSGQPGEGKTTTAVNLAIALVQLGGRVVVIDSDMRRPRVASLLKIPPTPSGLSTCLTGQSKVDSVLVETMIPNLYAIPCGPVPPNPAELLSSSSMQHLLAELKERFDYVVMDSPPVLHVSDARILAREVGAVILVAHGGKTPRDFVSHAKENLLHANANVIGVVLNNVDFRAVGYDYYYRYYRGYGYGYGYDEASKDANSAAMM
jgi:polysaccharide biosynthesis transport protein